MSEPQTFDPSKAFTVVNGPPPPPAGNPTMHAPTGNEPVTLGDLMDNPREAIGRIGASLKRDVTDPRLWLSLAASYFGPKAFNAVGPVVARAASRVGRGAAAIEPGDIVGMIPRPRSVDAAIKVAQKVGTAMQTPAAAPVETPPAVAAPPTASTTAAPAALPTDVGQIVKALAAEGVSPSEIDQAVKWLKAGAEPSLVWQRIQQARTLSTQGPFSKLPTPADVAAEIADRGPSNRSPQHRP